jgi:phage tail-like protein
MADPYRNYKFLVEVPGFGRGGFKSVSGMGRTTEVIEYREGGDNETPRKYPGQTTFGNITLERGYSDDEDFLAWCNLIYNTAQSRGFQGDDSYRKTARVYLRNKAGVFVREWRIARAWPTEFTVGDLDAGGNEILMQTLVIAHEGWSEVPLVA